MKYVIAIGVFQALLAVALLVKSKMRNTADAILIFLVACIAGHLLIKFVIFNFVADLHVRLQMNTFLGLCYGPLLYLYARKLKDPGFVPATKWFVFIPFVLAMVGYFSVISVLAAAPEAGYVMLKWYNDITFWCMIPLEAFYAILSWRISRQISKSQPREIRLVRQFALAFLLLCTIALAFSTVQGSYELNIFVRTLCYSVFLLLCMLVLRYRFYSLQNMVPATAALQETVTDPEVIPVVETFMEKPVIVQVEEADIRKHILSPDDQANVWLQLEQQMKTGKVFTDGTLNLDKLAELTGINKYHISETLNSYAQKSFYQYINEYRIGFAADQMKYFTDKGIAVNILSLAYDAGFNAKSSFNRYFKEIKGQTPSEYLKALTHPFPDPEYINGALS